MAQEPSGNDLRVALQLLGAARRCVASLPAADFAKVEAMLVSASKRITKVLYRLEPKRAQLAKE